MSNTHEHFGTGLLAVLVVGYFLPSIIASVRHHQSSLAITATNIIFGWTFVGWCIAFIWSLSGVVRRDPVIVVSREVAEPEPELPPSHGGGFFQPGDAFMGPQHYLPLGLMLAFAVAVIALWLRYGDSTW